MMRLSRWNRGSACTVVSIIRTWHFPFRRKKTVTTTIKAAGTVIFAPKVDAETHIEGMTIIAAQGTKAGESSYGVRAGGGSATLFVRWNDITAAPGKDGDPGKDGTDPSPLTALGAATGRTERRRTPAPARRASQPSVTFPAARAEKAARMPPRGTTGSRGPAGRRSAKARGPTTARRPLARLARAASRAALAGTAIRARPARAAKPSAPS